MNQWLARLSFSFIVTGGVLVWLGYKRMTVPGGGLGWREGLFFVAGGLCFALGLRGVKERHRPRDPREDDRPGE